MILFLIETTWFHWFIPADWQHYIVLSPRFVLAVILFVALFGSRHIALIMGLVFGLLYDFTFYGYMIGPYAFGMGLVGYVAGLVFNQANMTFLTTIPLIALGLFSFELLNFGVYRLFRIVEFSFGYTFIHHILPSLLFNLLFALILYSPLRFVLEKMDEVQKKRELI